HRPVCIGRLRGSVARRVPNQARHTLRVYAQYTIAQPMAPARIERQPAARFRFPTHRPSAEVVMPASPAAREVALDIDPEEFRRIGHALVDSIAEFLPSRRQRPVTPSESLAEVQQLIDAGRPLPTEGTDPGTLLARTAQLLQDHSLLNGHPRFLGYITSS